MLENKLANYLSHGKCNVLSDLCRIFYWWWTYGGYSGDLSPKSTLELLRGKENAVLIDVRHEARDCKSFWPFIWLNQTC